AVHFAPMISAVAATAQVPATCTGFIVRTTISPQLYAERVSTFEDRPRDETADNPVRHVHDLVDPHVACGARHRVCLLPIQPVGLAEPVNRGSHGVARRLEEIRADPRAYVVARRVVLGEHA